VRYISRHRAHAKANVTTSATSAGVASNNDSNSTIAGGNVMGDEQTPATTTAPAPGLDVGGGGVSHPQQLLLQRRAQMPLVHASVTTVGAGMRIMRRHSIAGTTSAGSATSGSGGSGIVGQISEEEEGSVNESMRRAMAFSSNTLKLRLASGQGLGGDNKAKTRASMSSPLLALPGTREACQSMLRAMASHHTNTNR